MMSTKEKLDELMREDDVFLTHQDKLKIYLEDNWKQLLGLLVGVLVVFAGINYYKEQKATSSAASSSKLSAILNSHKADGGTQDLENFVAQETNLSVKSQARLILAQQAYSQRNFPSALQHYSQIETESPSYEVKDIARLGKAYTQMQLKNYSEAIATLEMMKQSGSNFPAYELDIQIANCKKELGDKAAAIGIYKSLAADLENGIQKDSLEKKIKQLSE